MVSNASVGAIRHRGTSSSSEPSTSNGRRHRPRKHEVPPVLHVLLLRYSFWLYSLHKQHGRQQFVLHLTHQKSANGNLEDSSWRKREKKEEKQYPRF